MNSQDVIDYVLNSPHNTNPAVLKTMLNTMDNGQRMEPYVIDSEAYTYGDDALAAILEGRQVLIKVPNKDTTNALYSNFMPVLQYQLPNVNNDYLTLFYLKDGIAENILVAM